MIDLLDPYIFHILVFSPLLASIFITLIPTIDIGSKLAISRFFATIGFVSFLRIFVLFLNHQIQTENLLSFSIYNFNINFIFILTKHNVFLYGAAAATLLANMYIYNIKDTKSNIHQAAPFILTFFLYVSFGQADLRVALPILSIANFLVYYLIGFTEKIRRGSTIFQMGIFLFSCDALALVLLQIPYSDNISPTSLTLLNALLVVPGMARLCMPMFAPYMKKLLLNVDDEEGPFLITFLQLAGFLVLILVRNDLVELPLLLTVIVALMALIGAIYVSLVALTDHTIRTLPYYFLVFYSSLVAMILFLAITDDFWFLAASLLLTNVACFFHATRFALLIGQYRANESLEPRLRSTWFITLGLLIGLPGLGIGTSLWATIYRFIELGFLDEKSPWALFFRYTSAFWLIGLLILSFALILSVREEISNKLDFDTNVTGLRLPIRRSLLISPLLIALLSWLIPIVTFYAAAKGL